MSFQKKKSFGQHFLHDKRVITAIAEAVELGDGEVLVEVGPGEGALTSLLIERFGKDRIILAEADRDLVVHLHETFGVEVVFGDAAKADWQSVTKGKPWVLIGNLPYNAAAAIIAEALKSAHAPRSAVIMVQKEQADRMMARMGETSMLSLAIQLYAEPKKLFNVGSGAFSPPPKVESTVLKLTLKEKQGDEERILAFAKAGFGGRRKQLRKTIALQFDLPQETVEHALASIGLRVDIRPQDLSITDWRNLAAKL